jgi:hypothetical protein
MEPAKFISFEQLKFKGTYSKFASNGFYSIMIHREEVKILSLENVIIGNYKNFKRATKMPLFG